MKGSKLLPNSNLTIFLSGGITLNSDVRFHYDDDCIIFRSIMDGSNIGYMKACKEDLVSLTRMLKIVYGSGQSTPRCGTQTTRILTTLEKKSLQRALLFYLEDVTHEHPEGDARPGLPDGKEKEEIISAMKKLELNPPTNS